MTVSLTTRKKVSKETESEILNLLTHRQYGQKEIKKFRLHKWEVLATLTKKQGKESVKISLVTKGMLIGKLFQYLEGNKIKHTKIITFPLFFTEQTENIFINL